MSDFIPRRDSDLANWFSAFVTYAMANAAALGLTEADTAALGMASGDYSTALSSHSAARNSAMGAKQAKDGIRKTAEALFRRYAQDLQNRPSVTDAQRAELGLRVRDAQATAPSLDSANAPARPLGIIDNSRQLIHRLRFVEETAPTRRAKPAGVSGCEIWSCVLAAGAPAPADQGGMNYIATPSSGPLEMSFAAADAGKVAWYRLRWVNSRGERGEWSRPVAAMILG